MIPSLSWPGIVDIWAGQAPVFFSRFSRNIRFLPPLDVISFFFFFSLEKIWWSFYSAPGSPSCRTIFCFFFTKRRPPIQIFEGSNPSFSLENHFFFMSLLSPCGFFFRSYLELFAGLFCGRGNSPFPPPSLCVSRFSQGQILSFFPLFSCGPRVCSRTVVLHLFGEPFFSPGDNFPPFVIGESSVCFGVEVVWLPFQPCRIFPVRYPLSR